MGPPTLAAAPLSPSPGTVLSLPSRGVLAGGKRTPAVLSERERWISGATGVGLFFQNCSLPAHPSQSLLF